MLCCDCEADLTGSHQNRKRCDGCAAREISRSNYRFAKRKRERMRLQANPFPWVPA